MSKLRWLLLVGLVAALVGLAASCDNCDEAAGAANCSSTPDAGAKGE